MQLHLIVINWTEESAFSLHYLTPLPSYRDTRIKDTTFGPLRQLFFDLIQTVFCFWRNPEIAIEMGIFLQNKENIAGKSVGCSKIDINPAKFAHKQNVVCIEMKHMDAKN